MPNIINISSYAALYGGNFIPSLLSLKAEAEHRGINMFFVFPKRAQQMSWAKQFEHALWLNDDFFNSQKFCGRDILLLTRFMRQNDVKLVVTHFMSYNINMRMVRMLIRGGVFASHAQHFSFS